MLSGCYLLKDIQYFFTDLCPQNIWPAYSLQVFFLGSKILNIPTWTGIYLVLEMQTTKYFQI